MKHPLKALLSLLILITLGHFISRSLGWYFKYGLTDIVLHTIAGIMFGYVWIYFAEKNKSGSVVWISVTSITFATSFSFLWEVWEFWGYKVTPWITRAYIPTLSDSLGDIAFGFIGGVIFSLVYISQNKD